MTDRFDADGKPVPLEEAYAICRRITESHYENFPVASLLLPARIRRHVYPIYAFARYADDLADEYADRPGLLEWREMLYASLREEPRHPVFIALRATIHSCKLPVELLDNLISAFLQDMQKNRYQTVGELLQYCEYSANPVGRLILHLHGLVNDDLFRWSDHICTALQLTNFWQDISIDLQKDRIYIPQDLLQRHHLHDAAIQAGQVDEAFQELMRELIVLTRGLFREGVPLLDRLHGRLGWELRFTVAGGLAILDKIKKNRYDVFAFRPKLSKADWLKLAGKLTLNRRWHHEHTKQ